MSQLNLLEMETETVFEEQLFSFTILSKLNYKVSRETSMCESLWGGWVSANFTVLWIKNSGMNRKGKQPSLPETLPANPNTHVPIKLRLFNLLMSLVEKKNFYHLHNRIVAGLPVHHSVIHPSLRGHTFSHHSSLDSFLCHLALWLSKIIQNVYLCCTFFFFVLCTFVHPTLLVLMLNVIIYHLEWFFLYFKECFLLSIIGKYLYLCGMMKMWGMINICKSILFTYTKLS